MLIVQLAFSAIKLFLAHWINQITIRVRDITYSCVSLLQLLTSLTEMVKESGIFSEIASYTTYNTWQLLSV